MLAIVLFIANDITEGQEVIVRKLPIYFILYPLLAPVFIISAFYKFVRGRETVWALQDNKE